MEEKINANGKCTISDEVIATIAGAAACEVDGVAGMANRPNPIKGIVLSGAERSVAVLNRESTITLDIYIFIRQDGKIQDIAPSVQKNVKSAVQAMTGKPVTRVNVHVEGIKQKETEQQ